LPAWLPSYVGLREEKYLRFVFVQEFLIMDFLPYPVAALFFGNDLVVKIILFNLGVEVAIWTVGILLLTSSRLKLNKILNPPAISVLVAISLQMVGGKALLPQYAWEVLSMIGNCSIPMALMIIGASFYDLFKGFRPSSAYRVEMGAFLTRGLLVPTLFICYALYGWIPHYASVVGRGINCPSCNACRRVCFGCCKKLWGGH
jgi:predicted permease